MLVLALLSVTACEGHSLRIRNDNDLYAIVGTDRYYTQGFLAEWMLSEEDSRGALAGVMSALPLVAEIEHPFATVVGGHKVFNPADSRSRALVVDDQPYAGWLFGGLRLQNVTAGADRGRADRLDTWELDLGVIGPSSLAEEFQLEAHRFYGDMLPQGWDNQLDDEPGVELSYERTHRVWYREVATPLRFEVDALGDLGFSAGNVLTGAHAGVRLRFGGLQRDFDTNGSVPPAVAAGDGSSGPGLPFYGFLGVKGRAVAYTVFLDGNTFENSHSVDKEPFLFEWSGGVVVPLDSFRFGFAVTVTSPHFEETSSWHRFASVRFEFTF